MTDAMPAARNATARRLRVAHAIAPAPAAMVSNGNQVARSSSTRVASCACIRSVERNRTNR